MLKNLKTIKGGKNAKILIILSVVLLSIFCYNAFQSPQIFKASAAGENSFVNIVGKSLYDIGISGNYNTNESVNISEELSYTQDPVNISIILDYSTIKLYNIRRDGELNIVIYPNTFIEIISSDYNKFILDELINFSEDVQITFKDKFVVLENNKSYNLFNILSEFYNFAVINPTFNENVISIDNDLKLWYCDFDDYTAIIIDDYVISPQNNEVYNVGDAFCVNTNENLYASFAFNTDINYFKEVNNDYTNTNGAVIFSGGIFANSNEYNTMYILNDKVYWTDEIPTEETEFETGVEISGNYNAIKYYDSGDIKLCYEDNGVFTVADDTLNVEDNPFFRNYSLIVNELIVEIPAEENKVISGLALTGLIIGTIVLAPWSWFVWGGFGIYYGIKSTQAGGSFADGFKYGLTKILSTAYQIVENGAKIVENVVKWVDDNIIQPIKDAPKKPQTYIILAVIIGLVILYFVIKNEKS